MGDTLPGLRRVVKGFMPDDGYDLRHFKDWSSSKKRRVRDYYQRVHLLEAQERIIVRPRSKTNLDKLKDAFHGDIPSKQFKVAFVPYTQPKGLPGAKPHNPTIKYLKSGISINAGAYERLFVPFDKRALVQDAEGEINRVLKVMNGAKLCFVQTGEFQTLNGESPGILARRVLQYMNLYDGVKKLPSYSGNSGDHPSQHHWKYWLNGVVGFIFPKTLDINKMQKQISQGMIDAKARRKAQTDAIKLKERKDRAAKKRARNSK